MLTFKQLAIPSPFNRCNAVAALEQKKPTNQAKRNRNIFVSTCACEMRNCNGSIWLIEYPNTEKMLLERGKVFLILFREKKQLESRIDTFARIFVVSVVDENRLS